MEAFLEACLSPVNLVLTILLFFIVLYWLMVIFGALAVESLDFDVDADVDVDMDVDMDMDLDVDADPGLDIDADGHGGHSGGGMGSFGKALLTYFNVGEVPVMILLSFFVLFFWSIGILAHPLFGEWTIFLQLLLFIPFALVAAFVTKLVTYPIARFYRQVKAQEEAEQKLNLIGMRCKVISGSVTDRMGQVEVATDGAPLKLNARVADSDVKLGRGDEAVLVSKDEERGVYIVRDF